MPLPVSIPATDIVNYKGSVKIQSKKVLTGLTKLRLELKSVAATSDMCAGSDLDGEHVSDAARALCALASRDVGAAQAALQVRFR